MSKIGTRTKAVLGAATIALAASALIFGGATGASAASGDTNAGVRGLQLTPNSPASDFSVAGTTGTLSYNQGDGSSYGPVQVMAGDDRSRVTQLPAGLEFAVNACAPYNTSDANSSTVCSMSADRRTITITTTALTSFVENFSFNSLGVSHPVVSTGPISGAITSTFVSWPGTTTQAPLATLSVDTTPIIAPAVGLGAAAVAGLGVGGFALMKRRSRVAA